jgi:two-component system sensor histidine kinase BaeS
LLVSLAVAIAAALLTTLAVSAFITRRLTRPVQQMAVAAAQIAAGAYGTRIPPSGLGSEFATLDNAFNRMAAALEGTERRRRELLADLAHELRTPIATLGSFLEGIEDGIIPADQGTWRTLREQTGRLRRLADDIDTVSRAEERQTSLHLQAVDLDQVVDDAVRAGAAGYADKTVTLRHHRAKARTEVEADPDRLREVLDNLLANALRHTPPGGTVTVATTTGPKSRWTSDPYPSSSVSPRTRKPQKTSRWATPGTDHRSSLRWPSTSTTSAHRRVPAPRVRAGSVG